RVRVEAVFLHHRGVAIAADLVLLLRTHQAELALAGHRIGGAAWNHGDQHHQAQHVTSGHSSLPSLYVRSGYDLVGRYRSVDFARPGVDSAPQTMELTEPRAAEQLDGLQTSNSM